MQSIGGKEVNPYIQHLHIQHLNSLAIVRAVSRMHECIFKVEFVSYIMYIQTILQSGVHFAPYIAINFVEYYCKFTYQTMKYIYV